MRVLFFLQFPNPFSGAAWTRIAFFGQYMASKGHDISIGGTFSPKTINKAGRKKWNNLQLFNITPVIMSLNFFALIFNILSSILSSFVLMIWLRPQIVIISVPNGESALGAYLIAKMFRKRIVTDYRDLWEDYVIAIAKSQIYKKLYGTLKTFMTKCYDDSDLVITVTEPLAKDLISRGVKRVKIMTNGADVQTFKPYDKKITRKKLGYNEGDFILVYSGIIGEYYRIDVLIKAFQNLITKVQNAKLLLIGDGDYVKKLIEMSKELDINNKIFYLGPKTDTNEIAEILSAADVGIIPCSADLRFNSALPVKAFEYFACGIPAISTSYPDSLLSKLILENKVGLTSPPENVDALADALEQIHADRDFREKASVSARLLVEEKFDRNKIAEQFLNLIKC